MFALSSFDHLCQRERKQFLFCCELYVVAFNIRWEIVPATFKGTVRLKILPGCQTDMLNIFKFNPCSLDCSKLLYPFKGKVYKIFLVAWIPFIIAIVFNMRRDTKNMYLLLYSCEIVFIFCL